MSFSMCIYLATLSTSAPSIILALFNILIATYYPVGR